MKIAGDAAIAGTHLIAPFPALKDEGTAFVIASVREENHS